LPAKLIVGIAGPEEAKNLAGKVLPLIQIRLARRVWQKLRQRVKIIRRNCESRLQVPEMQYFIRSHNDRLSVIAVSNNPDRSPLAIQS